jgi:hypothetical protein
MFKVDQEPPSKDEAELIRRDFLRAKIDHLKNRQLNYEKIIESAEFKNAVADVLNACKEHYIRTQDTYIILSEGFVNRRWNYLFNTPDGDRFLLGYLIILIVIYYHKIIQ